MLQDKEKKEKIMHITQLKDKIAQFQHEGGSWEDDLLPAGKQYTNVEMREEIIIIVYSGGYLAMSKKAFEVLDLPEAVALYPKNNGLTGIKGSKVGGSCAVSNAEDYPKDNIYRFSNRSYTRLLGVFNTGKRQYYLGHLNEDGYIVIDHTNPCKVTEKRNA